VFRCLACLPRQARAPEPPANADAQPEESNNAPSAADEQQQSTTVVELYDDNMDADLQVEIDFISIKSSCRRELHEGADEATEMLCMTP